MLFDSHTHLDDEGFDLDRDEVIERAREAGVKYMLNPGADLASSIKGVNLAERYEGLYAAVGVHPHDVKDMDEATMEILKALSQKNKVVAIGEIGLDFYYDHSPRDTQRYWFKRQIQLAREVGLPIIIHERDAHQEVFDILKEARAGELGCVMHCFSGSVELAKEYVKLGMYISLGGPVTFKNARKPQEVAMAVPLDKLLIETDSPYLTPIPFRGKRNEPARVSLVAEKIAELRGLSPETLAQQTTENAKAFFRIG